MRIELGAGEHPEPGFVAVDLNPASADIVASALDLPFDDGTVEELRAVDVLEHLSYRDTDKALAEWARVCAKDAKVYVQVPDADGIVCRYMKGERLAVPPDLPQTQLMGMTWRLLGGHADGRYVKDDADFRWNAHYALFNQRSLCDGLDRAGFHVDRVQINGHPNVQAWAHRR